MHRFIIGIFLLFNMISGYAQNDIKSNNKIRNGIWLIPSLAKQINGIAIGPIGSDNICNLNQPQNSNGLNLQLIGAGIFLPLNTKSLSFSKYYNKNNDSFKIEADSIIMIARNHKVIHNGIVVSAFGTITSHVNGISISPFASAHNVLNGLSINPLWNRIIIVNGTTLGIVNSSLKVNGLQIGLINNTLHLKGIQIGLWNKNAKRKLPFINWQF